MWWRLPERPSAEARVGLVLSGGGARASFQIGALRYLYDRLGVTPQVITGTSAGSILATVLAQSADHAGQRQALEGLERVWLGMRESSEMFTELEWFALLRRRGPALVKAFTRQQRRQSTLGRSFARVADRTVRRGTAEAAALSAVAADGPDGQVTADEPTADGTWAPVNVVELVTALREAGRARPDLEAIVRGARRAQSMYRPGPIVDRLLDPEVFTPARVAASGVTLRIAVVALESGELRYVTERGELVDRCDAPVPGAPVVPLVEAVRASCAIPAVFAPVRLGEEHYVDGGVRETLPAEIAVERLGVGRAFAVVATPPGVPKQDSYADKDMLSIVLRSTAGIMSDEGLHDEVTYARTAGVTVIAPELDVHDALTVDPGLIAIAMDYGYLRAAEATQAATAEQRLLARDLIELRRQIWALEAELLAPGDDDATPDLRELVALKRELRALVTQAPQDWLPPGAHEWWRTFERHPWEVTVTPTWA